MKIPTILLALCTPAVAAAFTLAPLAAQASSSKQDIVSVAAENQALTTLVAAVKAAGLVDTLRGKGPFTVFAPTNAAFAKLPKGTLEALLDPANKAKLVAILTAHAAPSALDASAALGAKTVKTLEGTSFQVRLESGQLLVGDAKVVVNDVRASNGVVHIIDTVLLPEAKEDAEQTKVKRARDLIELAVEVGAPLFNQGDAASCASVYLLACRAIGVAEAVPADVKKRAVEGSKKAMTEKEAASRAWALRAVLDRCYEALSAKRGVARG